MTMARKTQPKITTHNQTPTPMTIQTIWATFFRYKNEINFEAENTLDQRYSRCKPQAHSNFPKSTFRKKKYNDG